MSNCPKCGKKLRIIDWKQDCPHCGTNLMFYGFEERFYTDAKKAEMGFARVNVALRKLKTAFVGNNVAIARLAMSILPVLMLLIPVSNVSITLPFLSKTVSLGIIGLYSMFAGGDFSFIFEMAGSEILGSALSSFRLALFAEMATVLFAVLVLLCTILCFVSINKMAKIICTMCVLGTVSAVLTVIWSNSFIRIAHETVPNLLSGSIKIGAIFAVIGFAAVFVVNLIVVIKGIEIVYEEGDFERAEIYKKVRKGEIRLEDLPQPVVETAATRAIEAKIADEKKNLYDSELEKNGEAIAVGAETGEHV